MSKTYKNMQMVAVAMAARNELGFTWSRAVDEADHYSYLLMNTSTPEISDDEVDAIVAVIAEKKRPY